MQKLFDNSATENQKMKTFNGNETDGDAEAAELTQEQVRAQNQKLVDLPSSIQIVIQRQPSKINSSTIFPTHVFFRPECRATGSFVAPD